MLGQKSRNLQFLISFLSSYLLTLYLSQTERGSMASTVSFLRLPSLAQKPWKSSVPPLPNPSIKLKLGFSDDSGNPLSSALDYLRSASLPLTTVALPFFLDAKASPEHPLGYIPGSVTVKCVNGAGCDCGGRRVRDTGGEDVGADPPHRDERAVREHAVGRLLGVAMATGADRPGRDQRAEEASQARPCQRRLRRLFFSTTRSPTSLPCPTQNSTAH